MLKFRTILKSISPKKQTLPRRPDPCSLDFIDPELYSHSTKMIQGKNNDKESLQDFTVAIAKKIMECSWKTVILFSSACIYKVPEGLRKVKESAYTPLLIAIGPLHQKDEHLQTPMQWVKWYYTHHLFNRLTEGIEDVNLEQQKLFEVLQQCAEKMEKCVDEAKKSYAVEVTVDDEKMSEMMLVDGCFILELLYASHRAKKSKEAGKMTTNGDNGTNLKMALPQPFTGGEDGSSSSGGKKHSADPILDNILTSNIVKQDLILLENQIPYFVLEQLFELTVAMIPDGNETLSLEKYVLSYFLEVENCGSETKTSSCFPKDCVLWVSGQSKEIERETELLNVKYFHILHLLQVRYSLRDLGENFKGKDSTKFSEFKVSAADLHNAGVEFLNHPSRVYVRDTKGISRRFSGIRFYIPSLLIHERTEVFLRNLIALEQCFPEIPKKFTSYTKVMSMLINSEKDVQVLKDAGIIYNYLGTDKDVPDLFDKLCEGVIVEGDLYLDACKQAINYYNGRYCLPMTIRYWRRLIFTSTWGVLAFALGIITSVITVAQFVRDFRK